MRVKRKFDSYDSYISYYNVHHHNVNEINIIENDLTVFADAKMKSIDLEGALLSFFMSLRDDSRFLPLLGRSIRSVRKGCFEQKFDGCYWTSKPLSPGYWYIAVSVYKNSF